MTVDECKECSEKALDKLIEDYVQLKKRGVIRGSKAEQTWLAQTGAILDTLREFPKFYVSTAQVLTTALDRLIENQEEIKRLKSGQSLSA
jgi:hypothetical protein